MTSLNNRSPRASSDSIRRSNQSLNGLDANSAAPANFRMLLISLLSAAIGLVAGIVAFALYKLIGLFTNLFFFHRWSTDFSSAGCFRTELNLYGLFSAASINGRSASTENPSVPPENPSM